MEPDSLSFLTLINKVQSHCVIPENIHTTPPPTDDQWNFLRGGGGGGGGKGEGGGGGGGGGGNTGWVFSQFCKAYTD